MVIFTCMSRLGCEGEAGVRKIFCIPIPSPVHKNDKVGITQNFIKVKVIK